MSSGYTVRVPIEIVEAMHRIINMYIKDEEKHYNESFQETKSDMLLQQITQADDIDTGNKLNVLVSEQPGIKIHIFNDLELVNRFIHSQELQAEIDSGEEYLADMGFDEPFIEE